MNYLTFTKCTMEFVVKVESQKKKKIPIIIARTCTSDQWWDNLLEKGSPYSWLMWSSRLLPVSRVSLYGRRNSIHFIRLLISLSTAVWLSLFPLTFSYQKFTRQMFRKLLIGWLWRLVTRPSACTPTGMYVSCLSLC